MIICLRGPPKKPEKVVKSIVHEWTKSCTDAGFERAIRTSVNETHWKLETGHQYKRRFGSIEKTLQDHVEIKRSADGSFVMDNKLLRKYEAGEQIEGPSVDFEQNYLNYFEDNQRECVSRANGAIIPRRFRIIGSQGCRASVTMISKSLTPYSVAGYLCELDWTELYSCNNGNGLRPRTCTVKVKTGISDELTNRNSSTRDNRTESHDERETTIDNTKKTFDGDKWSLGGFLQSVAEATLAGAVAKSTRRIFGGYESSKKEWTKTILKNVFNSILETDSTLTSEEMNMAVRSSFDHVTMTFQLITPPGFYQSVMGLKMTCGPHTVFPGFVDVRSRKAGNSTESHEYYIGNGVPNETSNVTANASDADTNVSTTTPSPAARGQMRKLAMDLWRYWDRTAHVRN